MKREHGEGVAIVNGERYGWHLVVTEREIFGVLGK